MVEGVTNDAHERNLTKGHCRSFGSMCCNSYKVELNSKPTTRYLEFPIPKLFHRWRKHSRYSRGIPLCRARRGSSFEQGLDSGESCLENVQVRVFELLRVTGEH